MDVEDKRALKSCSFLSPKKKKKKSRQALHEIFLNPNLNVQQQVSQSFIFISKSRPPYSVDPSFLSNISASGQDQLNFKQT